MTRPRLTRRRAAGISAAACLLLALAAVIVRTVLTGSLDSQLAAKRWETGELRYAQVSCFFGSDDGLTSDDILTLENKIDTTLAGESIQPADGARLWIDAWSTETTLTVKSDYGTVTARAIGTGGDWFQFHPLSMASGWYYSEDDLMQDAVILDRALAWSLFGGYDLVDSEITINGVPCRVAGVAEVPDSAAEAEAYGDDPTLYLPWSLLETLETDAAAVCYEAVVPDPVSDFAKTTVTDALGLDETSYKAVSNTGRFGYLDSLSVLGSLGARTQRDDGIAYPFWENAARLMETHCALLTALILALAVWPVIYLTGNAVRLIRIGKNMLQSKIRRMRE